MPSRSPAVRGVARFLIAEWRSDARAARRSFHDVAAVPPTRASCDAADPPTCAPCRAPAQPACRSPARAALRGQRVLCRPPPHAARPPCAAPEPPCPLSCDLHNHNTFKGYVQDVQCTAAPRGQCGDSMDRVAQRISAARLTRRHEYEREVAARAAQPPAAPPAPPAYGLAAGREVVRATDGRDYVVLPPLSQSQPKCEHYDRTSTVELDPAKGCVINRSSHVDPCAHRSRLLLEIDRSEVSKVAQSPLPPTTTKTALVSTPSSALYQSDESENDNAKKSCKGSALGPLTDWCISRPKIKPQRPDCVQASLVERIQRRSNNSTTEVRKFHTAASFSQNVTPTERNEIGEVAAKIKADAHKLNQMLNDRNKLKEAGRGRNTNLEETEEASASGQLELRAAGGGAAVRVHVSLLGGAPAPQPTGPTGPTGPTASADGLSRDPNSSYYGKCDSWLSIKNIQKKLTGCRKDLPPVKNIGDDKSVSENTLSKEVNLGGVTTPCERKVTQNRTQCGQKLQQPSDSPCQKKQTPGPPPCSRAPPTSRCSAQETQFVPDIFVI